MPTFWPRNVLHSRSIGLGSPRESCPFPSIDPARFPINSLPVELLCRVFKLASHDEHSQHAVPKPISRMRWSDRNSPIRLAQVCRYWRAIAISEPTLWSVIVKDRPAGRGTVEYIKLCLERSGNSCLLDLNIRTEKLDDPDVLQEMMKHLIAHISRWRRVCFTFYHSPTPDDPLLTIIPGSAINLTTIVMKFWELEWELDLQHKAWNAFECSPMLHQVELDGTRTCQYILPEIRWSCLTYLGVWSLQHETIINILKQSQALQELWIMNPNGDIPSTVVPVTLPTLVDLHVSTSSTAHHASTILRYLRAPSLLQLDIKNGCYGDTQPHSTYLHHFLSQSQCRVQSLTIWDYVVSDTDLVKCLYSSYLTELTHLSLHAFAQDETIRGLTIPYGDHKGYSYGALPCLKSLTLSKCMVQTEGLVGKLIQSRSPGLLQATVRMKPVDEHEYIQDRTILNQYQSSSQSILFSLDTSIF